MLRIARILAPLCLLVLVLVLVPVAGADAARPASATFTARFEAQRTAKWERPRIVTHTNCRGGHYTEADGAEDQKVTSRGSFKVVVTGSARAATWTFGRGQSVVDPRDMGVEAAGPHTREWNHRSGSTGGWCGAGEPGPKLDTDCGTQLAEYKLNLFGRGGTVDWNLGYKDLPRERQGFYRCTLNTPEGLPATGFPRLEAKVRMADVFDRRKRTIVVQASKSYGPVSIPIANYGVSETRSGAVSWKLTLTRSR